MMSYQSIQWIIRTAREAAWAPVVVLVVHVVASQVFELYTLFPSLDIPMHFLGGVVIAFFCHRAAVNASGYGIIGPFHPVSHVVLVLALTCSATVIWEFAEFISDQLFHTQSQVDLEDTLLDMFLGIAGGIVFLLVYGLMLRLRLVRPWSFGSNIRQNPS